MVGTRFELTCEVRVQPVSDGGLGPRAVLPSTVADRPRAVIQLHENRTFKKQIADSPAAKLHSPERGQLITNKRPAMAHPVDATGVKEFGTPCSRRASGHVTLPYFP